MELISILVHAASCHLEVMQVKQTSDTQATIKCYNCMAFILLWCAALTPYWNALAPDQKEHIDAFSELCTMYTVVKCMKAYRLFIKVSGCIDPINDRVAAAMELATNLLNEHMVADNLSCRALYLQDRDTLEKLHSLVLEIWRIQVDCNGAIHASVTGRHVCQLAMTLLVRTCIASDALRAHAAYTAAAITAGAFQMAGTL